MTVIKPNNLPDPYDLPPGAKGAWRELVNQVKELQRAVNGTHDFVKVVDKNQSNTLIAVQGLAEDAIVQSEIVGGIQETYAPTEPVLVPSTPILSTGTGVINVRWDGFLLEIPMEDGGEGNDPIPGTPIPVLATDNPGFRYVYAEWSETGLPDPPSPDDETPVVSTWYRVGAALNEAGTISIQVPQGTTRYYRLTAVNYAGATSGFSESASITSEGVGIPDLKNDVIAEIDAAQEAAQDAINDATAALLAAEAAVLNVVTEYAVNSSETVAPTSGWSTAQPTRTPEQFIWVRTKTTYGDTSESTSAPALLTGNTGSAGTPGTPGTPGRGVQSTAVAYQLHTNGTTAPTGSWVASPPAMTQALPFLWTRTLITYTDASTSTSYSVAARGADGAPGVGISNGTITYQVGSSGTTAPTGTWLSTVPATSPGQFLWTRTVITYTNGATSTTYSVGAHGATGSTGAPGRGIASTSYSYQVSSSGTAAPTGVWQGSVPATSPGQFLWTRTTITYTDSSTSVSYSVAAHGATGATGVSVTSITPYYFQTGGAAPAKPTASPPPAPWTTTEPGYLSSTTLYRSDRVLFSNSTFAYTDVSVVSAYTASKEAITVANLATQAAQGLVKASQADPGHAVGRIWLVLNSAGDTIGIKQSNGTAWSSYTLMADQILVPSSVGPIQIANGAITGPKIQGDAINGKTITGALVQSSELANRGVKFDDSGFRAYDASGNQTVNINATTGAATFSGEFTSRTAGMDMHIWSSYVNDSDRTSMGQIDMTPSALHVDPTPGGVYSFVTTHAFDGLNVAHLVLEAPWVRGDGPALPTSPGPRPARIDLTNGNNVGEGVRSGVSVTAADYVLLQAAKDSSYATVEVNGETGRVNVFTPMSVYDKLEVLQEITGKQALTVGDIGATNQTRITPAFIQSYTSSGAVQTLHLNGSGGGVRIGQSAGGAGELRVYGNAYAGAGGSEPIPTDQGWTNITTIGSGWTAGTGINRPRVRRVGNQVFMFGVLTRSGTTGNLSNLCTIPSGFQISASSGNTFIGTNVSGTGYAYTLRYIASSNIIYIDTAYLDSGSMGSGATVPLVATWFIDGN